jgi:hypothetical protein
MKRSTVIVALLLTLTACAPKRTNVQPPGNTVSGQSASARVTSPPAKKPSVAKRIVAKIKSVVTGQPAITCKNAPLSALASSQCFDGQVTYNFPAYQFFAFSTPQNAPSPVPAAGEFYVLFTPGQLTLTPLDSAGNKAANWSVSGGNNWWTFIWFNVTVPAKASLQVNQAGATLTGAGHVTVAAQLIPSAGLPAVWSSLSCAGWQKPCPPGNMVTLPAGTYRVTFMPTIRAGGGTATVNAYSVYF